MATKALKQVFRKEVKAAIRALSEEEKTRQSEILVKRLLKTDAYEKSSRVCIYLSMNDEVRTGAIISDMFASGKKCFIPRYESNSHNMDFLLLKSAEDLKEFPETEWKIKQPAFDEELPRENCLESGGVDLIVMPGLAFSSKGDRCGRGGGYYDTYLARYRSTIGKLPHLVALAFNEQIRDDLPTDSNDIPVNTVIWEKDGKLEHGEAAL